MTIRDRWALAAAIGLPLVTMTVYLLWIWPWPAGASVIAETGPYVVSLLTGLPFVWRLTRKAGRWLFLPAYLAGGFLLLWIHALAVLCWARGMCL